MNQNYEAKEIARSLPDMNYDQLRNLVGYVTSRADRSKSMNEMMSWEILAYEISNRIEKLELECVG